MHAPPPFQTIVRHFGVWRFACGVLITLSWLVTMAWATAAAGAEPVWLMLSVSLLATASVALLWHAWRLAPTRLRWDGQLWHLGPVDTMGQEPQAGRLMVALDLGDWMLLRFVAEGWRCGLWLPLQRGGHEPEWHGLRATVYCARPVSLPAAAPF